MGIDPVTYFLQGAVDCRVDELTNGYIVFFVDSGKWKYVYAHGIACEEMKSDIGLTSAGLPNRFHLLLLTFPHYFSTDHDLSTAYCARYFRLFAIQVALHFFQEVSKGEVAVAGKKTRSSGLR